MTLRKHNCYVITGGPGVGKTTLLNELAKHSYYTVPENARAIIKEEMDSGGDGLPWKNKERYTYLMLEAAVLSYHRVSVNDDKIYFFDRGILDAICYADMIGLNISAEMDQLAKTLLYNIKVFMLPPWQEIYHTDKERKQTWDEALYTFKKMKATYLNYGYEVVELPKDTVKNRVTFVLEKMNATSNY
ncbi:AAA family ATPase [Pedobacter xixiisoli]|uniref:Predicted ATPase n=1 Tax=Pedobacter xixiisoli TaxID=1476464 RepID=A0A286A092_9SPHI|nr:AAA family ATPase [Pedobacter xixiisoli]SOD15316.1 Predicted ATPase [Pedobacter xixiisoli]